MLNNSLDDNASLMCMLTTANFGLRPRNAIVELCCEMLTDLVNLPPIYLDLSISNLHMYLSNVDNSAYRVQLNATKYITLHAIKMRLLDQINCNDGLEPTNVTTLDAHGARSVCPKTT